MQGVRLPPWRTPFAVSDALKDILKDKTVCELGCAEGDNMEFMGRYAKKVIGFEYDPERYQIAQARGYDVTAGDYYKDPLPEADIYYFWPDDGERDSEYLVQTLLQSGFEGTILLGADPGFPPEIPAFERCAEIGHTIDVPYNEGPGHRQNGIFKVTIIDVSQVQQQAVFVLSAPRAGSSATAGSLQISGFDLGKNVTTVKNKHNAKGYFENQSFLTFNEKVLKAVNSSIFAFAPLNPTQTQKALTFKEELKTIIQAEFGNSKFFALKDPRLNILQDLYRTALNELDIKLSGVILSRKADASARSLVRMIPGMTYQRAIDLYGLHYKLAEQFLTGAPQARFAFEDLYSDVNTVIKQAHFDLGVPYGIARHKQQELAQFVEKRLVHHGK